MEIEGYRACSCGCGRQELLYVTHLTGGLAWECFSKGAVAHLRRATVLDHGATVTIELRSRMSRSPSPRGQRGSADTRRLAHAAREAARKRLAQLEHDLYEVLYADERRKRGLPIVPLRVPEGSMAATVASKLGAVVYSADIEPGVADADAFNPAV